MKISKKFSIYISLIVLGALLVGSLIPLLSSPAYAAQPKDKKVEVEYLDPEEVRIDQFTIAKLKNTYKDKGQDMQEWEVTISTLPQTLKDLKTKITVEWRKGKSDDGVVFYETGNNIYYARVTGTRVTVEYGGILAAWDPVLYLGDTKLSLTEGPRQTKDTFIGTDYDSNVIEWVYETPEGLFSSPYRVLRYVRQIEGQLQEFYILESNPGKSLRIANRYQEEAGFIWGNNLFAYDSNGLSLIVSGSASEKFVDFRELGRPELEYPVIIDPTTTFSSLYNTYELSNSGTSYSTIRTATSGTVGGPYFNLRIGQEYNPGSNLYSIYRTPIYFPTSTLPDNAIIVSARIRLYGSVDDSNTDFKIIVQTGGTHPNRPPYPSDYTQGYYSGDYGTFFYTSIFSTSGYNDIYLTDPGEALINLTGYTTFLLRSDRDIDNITPTTFERIYFMSDSHSSGNEPQLVVTYTLPITKPTISTWSAQSVTGTSATLRGYLSSDGGADCNVWFDYGTTTSYGSSTSSSGGYSTGESFSKSVPGLEYGTLYHYTARAQNSAGISGADDETFLTKPNTPTSFTVTPGDAENVLAWTKGTGSTKTMVRSSTSSYPLTPTSGTQVYFDSGTGTTDDELTNGVTYYYSIWGYTSSGSLEQYSTSKAIGSGTPVVLGPPEVTTYAATAVGITTATLNGFLNSLGGYADADVWFQYYWGAGSWTDHETTPVEMIATGAVTPVEVSTLPADTLIHMRVAATGTGGTDEGADIPFTTGEASAPTMETLSASGETGTSATLYGKVSDWGGASVTARFDWGLSNEYGEQTGQTSGLITGDTVQVTLYDLNPSTLYHFRVVGWNSADTGYGADGNFTTSTPTAPTVSTLLATGVGATSAMLHGQLTGDGGVDTDTRFTWSDNTTLSENTTSSGWQTGKRVGDPFEYFATNMTYDTAYYFRAEASNTPGVVINGTILSFTTVFAAPQNFVATPLTSTSIGLSWVPQSDKTLIVARTGTYPADRLDGEQVYMGPGESTVWEDRIPGITYFFRAWSWREGDNYSGTYAEDACTTPSAGGVSEIETPYDEFGITNPDTPTSWWQGPGSSSIQNWPLVSYIDSVADGMGMARGSMWAIFAGIAAVLVAIGGAILLPLRFAGFGAGLLAVGILVGVGVLAGWIIAFYAIVGIALLILLPSGAGG